jgi:hypothetical protein
VWVTLIIHICDLTTQTGTFLLRFKSTDGVFVRYVLKVYLKYLNKVHEWVLHTKICPQTLSFWAKAPALTSTQSSGFSSMGILRNPSVIRCSCKWRNTSPTNFIDLPNHFSTDPRPLNGSIVHWTQVSMRVWIQAEDILNVCCELRDLISNKNSTFIKLKTCNINVLCQLKLKC